MNDFRHGLEQLLSCYQRRTVTRTGLVGVLGLGCLAALLWRLHTLGLGLLWLCGAGLAGLLALCLWQGLAIKQHWLSQAHTLLKLDQAMGLEARLVTAAEFAHTPHQPLLYPVLVQDTTQSLTNATAHLPHMTDRWTVALAAALLLLLLWPFHQVLPKQQLAKQTPSALPPFEPPVQPPPGQSQQQTAQDQQRASQDQAKGSGDSGERSKGEKADSSSDQGARPDQPQTAQGAPQPAEGSQPEDKQPPSATQQARADEERASEAGSVRLGQEQASARRQGESSQQAAQDQGRSGQQGQKGQTGSQMAQEAAAGQHSSVSQDQLKADIQQLLQELSQELQQLQAQVTQQSNVSNPLAGTTTDPQLYEAASSLEKSTGSQLPIQLDVDTQPTSARRPGGGVGQPSGQVADASPQQQPEEAELAVEAAEDSVVHRQPIPPEYRPVFERLSRPSEK